MPPLRVLTASEQVAEHLRGELVRGTWSGLMPGGDRLAEQFGVGRNTMEAALRQLERDGLLVAQGPGRRRRIVLPRGLTRPSLRVAILLSAPEDAHLDYVVDLQHQLDESGHAAVVPGTSLMQLGMDVQKIARLVRRTDADAWVVASGSREVLEWFTAQPLPAFALFGRRRGLPIASVGPDKPPVLAQVTRRLIELGHRRIVLLTRRASSFDAPGASERAFLAELGAHGLPPGRYNLPYWEDSVDGFHECFKSLFAVTRPSALILDEAALFFATQQLLINRKRRVPQDLSLVCTDGDPHFSWCRPTVAHIRWDPDPVVRRIVRWTDNISHGRDDRRQTLTKAEFVEGGTIGPARQ